MNPALSVNDSQASEETLAQNTRQTESKKEQHHRSPGVLCFHRHTPAGIHRDRQCWDQKGRPQGRQPGTCAAVWRMEEEEKMAMKLEMRWLGVGGSTRLQLVCRVFRKRVGHPKF